MEEKKDKMVEHPEHYQSSNGIECIVAIEAAVEGLDGIEAVDTANAIKYLWRWKNKNGKQDLEKAKWYINHLINKLDIENGKKIEDERKANFAPYMHGQNGLQIVTQSNRTSDINKDK